MNLISFIRLLLFSLVVYPLFSSSQTISTTIAQTPNCFGDVECVNIVFSDLDNNQIYNLVIKRDIGGFLIEEDIIVDLNSNPNFNVLNSSFNYCFAVYGDFLLSLVLNGNEIDNIQYETQEYPTPIILSASFVENVDCFGESTGSVDVLISGGSGDYTYTWTDISGVILGTSENSVNVWRPVYII